MPPLFSIIIGKFIRTLSRLRGGGTALPGLVVEKINPQFAQKALSKLPKGVVVISGTNGKTTTTKMVVSLLESQGLKVFTNRSGSNFIRGVIAELLGVMSPSGKLDADIAVLELDEAHAVQFVKQIKPEHSLLLNVMRDQLDRFGEIDNTAKLLEQIAQNTSNTVVINKEDNRLLAIGEELENKVAFYGLSAQLRSLFPNDDDLHHAETPKSQPIKEASVILTEILEDGAVFSIDEVLLKTDLKINGAYNIFNAAGALALVKTILPESKNDELLKSLSEVSPAFGRGETIIVDGRPLDLVLVKNPAGFRLGLSSFDNTNRAVMIAINDSYADGRDVSWLWDVDFKSLNNIHSVGGTRAYDMALRLENDEVTFKNIDTNISLSLKKFLKENQDRDKRIYCTYTAMLAIRKERSKIAKVEDI